MNRNEIEALKVGDVVKRGSGDGRWGKAERVTKISYRGVSVKGQAYVGGETAWSEGATMTFSLSEGDRFSCSTTELCRHNDLDRHHPPRSAPPVTTASPLTGASTAPVAACKRVIRNGVVARDGARRPAPGQPRPGRLDEVRP